MRAKRNGLAARGAARDIAILVFAFALMLLCLSAYYLKAVGFEKLWYCLGVRVFKFAAGNSHITFGLPEGGAGALPYLAIYVLLPVIYSISLWCCWRSRKDAAFPWNEVTLLSLSGLCLFLDVAVSINWLRLFAVSLPGIVLVVWAIGELPLRRRAVFIAASIALGCIAVRQIEVKRTLSGARGAVPGGRLATTPKAYEKLRWLAAHTRRGEWFLQAGWPGVYLPFGCEVLSTCLR